MPTLLSGHFNSMCLHTLHTRGDGHYLSYTTNCMALYVTPPCDTPGRTSLGWQMDAPLLTYLPPRSAWSQSLQPVASTKGQWDRTTTMGERPFRQQHAASAQHKPAPQNSRYISHLMWFKFTSLIINVDFSDCNAWCWIDYTLGKSQTITVSKSKLFSELITFFLTPSKNVLF